MPATRIKLSQKAMDYLTFVSTPKRRGRKPDVEKLKLDLEEIRIEIDQGDHDVMVKLNLHQQAIDLEDRIAALEAVDTNELRKAFISEIAAYAEAKGISSKALRAVGVPAADLKEAA